MSTKNWVRKLFAPKLRPARKAPSLNARLGIEALCDRIVPAVAAFGIVDGTLMITTDDVGTAVEVRTIFGNIYAYNNGVHFGTSRASSVTAIKFQGGAGNDVFTNKTAIRSTIKGGGGNDLLIGGSNQDAIYGEDGHDVLKGGAGNDLLNGGTGQDVLNGQAGDDYLIGGLDNDRFLYNLDAPQGSDVIQEFLPGGGDDLLDFSAGVANGVTIDLRQTAVQSVSPGTAITLQGTIELVYGTQAGDSITGNGADNFIDGGTGNDALYGFEGNDRLYGGAGNDVLSGMSGDDLLFGGTGSDQYRFVMDGSDGADSVIEHSSDAGIDTLDYSQGWWMGVKIDIANMRTKQQLNPWMAVTLYGSGIENVDGTQRDDVIVGNDLNNRLSGNGGNDLLDGANGMDYLLGGDGNDNMYGGNGIDWLDGGTGRDRLSGSAREDDDHNDGVRDVLIGGSGSDEVNGDGRIAWLSGVNGDGEDEIRYGHDELALGVFMSVWTSQVSVGMAGTGTM